jgi:hypothetical protein
MPLQNRVTPLGELIATPARGLVYGNRGCLHDEHGRIRRRHAGRRWIACRLEFRGWRRSPLMQPGRFTELIFLDEATALAAGHRPCAECRNADYRRWQRAWAAAHPGAATNADAMDRVLHADRLDNQAKRTFGAPRGELPTGAMVLQHGAPWLVTDDELRLWTPGGYTRSRAVGHEEPLTVLTPASAVAAIAAGYEPRLHPTAVSRVA